MKESIELIKAELEEKPSQEEPNDQEGDENKSMRFNFIYLSLYMLKKRFFFQRGNGSKVSRAAQSRNPNGRVLKKF